MPESIVHLSSLVGSPLLDSGGERLGRMEDVVVRLDHVDELPPVIGLKARIGGRDVFLPIDRVAQLGLDEVRTSTTVTGRSAVAGCVRRKQLRQAFQRPRIAAQPALGIPASLRTYFAVIERACVPSRSLRMASAEPNRP